MLLFQSIEDGVKVSLNFTVTAKHMETIFYVVYGVGTNAEQYPIQIDLKGNILTAQL